MAAEFAGAGKEEGLQVWRIEQKLAAPVPESLYGQFYEGDSYIVLKTTKRGSGFEWTLFFWLGKDSEVVHSHSNSASEWTSPEPALSQP